MLQVVIFLALLSSACLANTIPYDQFVGTYKFQEWDHNSETGKDYFSPELNNRIVLSKTKDGLRGEYFGFLHGEEHGNFFFREEMLDLGFTETGDIKFKLGNRTLFDDPKKVKKSKKFENGFSAYPLSFSGKITKDSIFLTCVGDDCENSGGKEMIFKRVKIEVRNIFYRTAFKDVSEQDRTEIVSDMEYSIEKLKARASVCGITFIHDDGIKPIFLFKKGTETKALDSFGTDVELWEVIEKFYGCPQSDPKPH